MNHRHDIIDITESSDVVYDVPCGGYEKSCIGETGEQFGLRLKEHGKEVAKIVDKNTSEPEENFHK